MKAMSAASQRLFFMPINPVAYAVIGYNCIRNEITYD